jgi:hypothetical protein
LLLSLDHAFLDEAGHGVRWIFTGNARKLLGRLNHGVCDGSPGGSGLAMR